MVRRFVTKGAIFAVGVAIGVFLAPELINARNITTFSDTISDSSLEAFANHTFRFTIGTDISPGGVLTFTPPTGFSITSTSTFSERNVELVVNSMPRVAAATVAPGVDGVTINDGAPGSIVYTLNPNTGLSDGDTIEFRVGNQTTGSLPERQVIIGTSSTTTLPADVSGVQNANTLGTHEFGFVATDGTNTASTEFVIFLNETVGVGPVDTTEEIPPVRFNGAPTGTISGTTPNVEISLNTDEIAACRYSTTASTSYAAMVDDFNSSGQIVHTKVLAVTPETSYTFYVRCIDDEGNFNIDDYLISFTVPAEPDGEPNDEGNNEGDGSGPNDSGSGGGTGTGTGGGNTGNGGGSQSSGGGGGGSGGGSGSDSSSGTGGGFENEGPYESGEGRVFINGNAWPGADIVVLVDGQEAETGRANNEGKFSVTIDEIARGVYTFGVYATDDNDVKSSTFSTSFTVSGARATNLSNINIAPSIEVTPDPVDIGGTATIRGYAPSNSSITIQNKKSGGNPTTLLTNSDGDGFYTTTLSTAGLSQGTYEIRVKAEQASGISTDYSNWVFYGIGEEADVQINADLNRDGSVNLTDFSILLFWWGGNGGDSDPPADINQDGSVSLTDFSILLFNWTG